jgi:hypothetical protein
MKSDLALALIGARLGITLAQFKGDMATDYLSGFFRERWHKVFRTPGPSDKACE